MVIGSFWKDTYRNNAEAVAEKFTSPFIDSRHRDTHIQF